MFKKKILILLGGWLALAIMGLLWIGSIKESNREAYQILMEKSGSDSNKSVLIQKTRQQRLRVTKHVILAQGPERLQWRLRSVSSELTLDQHGGHTEIVEHFQKMGCAMQEALVYVLPDGRKAKRQSDGRYVMIDSDLKEALEEVPLSQLVNAKREQLIRQVEADNAIYHYKTQELIAEQVSLARYWSLGHQLAFDLPATIPLMWGKASWMQLSLANQAQPFRAKNFQASLQALEEIP